jgi:very-short-patch-repair endonuclease
MSDAQEQGMSEGARRLWRALRSKKVGGAKFRRDVPVGPYRAGFLCEDVRLVVEVDDAEAGGAPRDPARDQWFFANGYRVLLFRAADILANLDGVVSIVETELRAAPRNAGAGRARRTDPAAGPAEGGA